MPSGAAGQLRGMAARDGSDWRAMVRSKRQTYRTGGMGAQRNGSRSSLLSQLRPLALLAAWIKEQGKDSSKILFPSARGGPLSSDSVQYLVTKYAAVARKNCSSLLQKRVSHHLHCYFLSFARLPKSSVESPTQGRVTSQEHLADPYSNEILRQVSHLSSGCACDSLPSFA